LDDVTGRYVNVLAVAFASAGAMLIDGLPVVIPDTES